MPYLNLKTNQQIGADTTQKALKSLSQGIAEALGKSENYVMISIESSKSMLFAGSDAGTAYIELKSLGLPEDQTYVFSATLCQLVKDTLGIDPARIYIEFAAPARHMWGWNGKTF